MKALVFDLDDTLYKEEDFVYGAFLKVSEYLSEKYSIVRDEVFQAMKRMLVENGRGRIFDDICALYEINENVDMLIEMYRNAAPGISLYEDAEHTLRYFKGKCRLGLITDGKYYVQWNKIKLLDIEKYFDSIIVTDDHGKDFWKPNTKPYLKMAGDLGIPLHDMAYIGDNPNKDFYGAKQLGIRTVRIIRPVGDNMGLRLEREYEADIEVHNLYELEAIADRLFEMR